MRRVHRVLLPAFLVAAVAAFLTRPAFADEVQQARIIPTPGSPIALTHCSFDGEHTAQNAVNRSSLFLESFTVRWTAFDHSGTAMGQADEYFTFSTDLAPGDTTTQDTYMRSLNEPLSALSTFRCRMQSAKFEGGKSWEFGHVPWRGRLSPLLSAESFVPERNSGNQVAGPAHASQAAPIKVAFTVANAWNDTTNLGTIVHVTLDVKGSSQESTLRPDNVSLKIALANGGKKSYAAMTQVAPSYQKINALTNQMVVTPEVDPKSDLGGLGSIIVPPNGSVRVTASFLIGPDVLSNPNDNRDVAIR